MITGRCRSNSPCCVPPSHILLCQLIQTGIILVMSFRAAVPIARRALARPAIAAAPRMAAIRPMVAFSARGYAAASGLKKEDIQQRILEVMKGFEKVDGAKVR